MKKTIFFSMILAFVLSTSANAAFITIGTSDGGIYDVDTSTGVATFVASGPTLTDLARDASGNLWGVDFNNLYSFDTNTSTFSIVGAHNTDGMNALTFENGVLYGAGFRTQDLYTINTTNAAVTSLGTGGFKSAGDLAFNSTGDLFLTAMGNGNDMLVDVNSSDGSTSLIGATGVGDAYGLAFIDGTLFGVSANRGLYTVDMNTGAATQIGTITGLGSGVQVYGATVSAIPIPAAVWLFATGLLGLIGFSKKRRP